MLNFFIGLALQGKNLTIYGEGQQKRNVLFVEDCVEALLQVAAAENTLGEVYFASGDDECAIATFAREVVGKGGVDQVPWPEDWVAMDVGDVSISNARIKEAIDWRPQVALKDGLLKTRYYYEANMATYLGVG